jgi:hypothetical protein
MVVNVMCRQCRVPRVHIELQILHVLTEGKEQTHRHIALSEARAI